MRNARDGRRLSIDPELMNRSSKSRCSRGYLLLASGALLLSLTAVASEKAFAFQAFTSKAKKYGAKDCLFCHTQEDGGDNWNERGQWLIDEKARRKAERVDVNWLAHYTPEGSDKKDKTIEAAPRKPDLTDRRD